MQLQQAFHNTKKPAKRTYQQQQKTVLIYVKNPAQQILYGTKIRLPNIAQLVAKKNIIRRLILICSQSSQKVNENKTQSLQPLLIHLLTFIAPT